MSKLTQSTPTLKKGDIDRNWFLLDAKGQILGRFATDVSQKLIGKHKPNFTPHMDNGDYVVVVNAGDVEVTGKKLKQKIYTRYSGYPSGLKETPLKRLMEKDPRKVIQNAVSGMLPKNKHRKRRMTRLFVFKDDKHPYEDKFSSKN